MQAIHIEGSNVKVMENLKIIPLMIALLLAGFVGTFNETALNIALSNFIEVFSITESTAQWLTTSYLLTLGIVMPLSGVLIQRFTTRKLFLTAVFMSLIGALVAALAGNFQVLLLGRVLQAFGTGIIIPLMYNIVLIIFPIHKRGMAMGLVTMVYTAAPAVGPTVSGLILSNYTWHWIFWISFTLMMAALIVGWISMQNVSQPKKINFDVVSLVLSTIGFGGVVFGFSQAGEGTSGWLSIEIYLPIIIGGLGLYWFIKRQLSMAEPLMDLRVFFKPMFIIGNVLIFICMIVNLSVTLLLPMFLIRVLHMGAFSAAITLLPGGIIYALISPINGRLFDRFGPKWLVRIGTILMAAGMCSFIFLDPDSSKMYIILMHIIVMLGLLFVWMPAQTNGMTALPPHMHKDGNAVMNTIPQIAGAIGIALAVSIMTVSSRKYSGDLLPSNHEEFSTGALVMGIQSSFIFLFIVAIVGVIASLFLRRIHGDSDLST
ncbi:DHA2 family efflux MFS transporter permease subunit [Paenibacillus sp. NPDC056722]|uniref:DHA2 family efflux MFS transporter permease subunit n=1 Tax=Paenibacillus sp. NPDC056722 TaxID=3345924 RepID=UPI00369D4306